MGRCANDGAGIVHTEVGLPDLRSIGLEALIFDLDGVVTRTAAVHAAAWKHLFDDYLRIAASRAGQPFVPFDAEADYARYVDGKPRYDGVRSLLLARGIRLPDGDPDDPPGRETVCGLGNRKNALFADALKSHGVEAYPGSVRLIRAVRRAGMGTAVVSSSLNCRLVLGAASLADLFDVVIDGIYATENGLHGKPAPDTFLRAVALLETTPDKSAVFEDAIVGIEAARAGAFAMVVAVDRGAGHRALRNAGADLVVSDLGEFPIG